LGDVKHRVNIVVTCCCAMPLYACPRRRKKHACFADYDMQASAMHRCVTAKAPKAAEAAKKQAERVRAEVMALAASIEKKKIKPADAKICPV
jgi:hypothetical protein